MGLGRDGKVWGHDMGRVLGGRLVQVLGGMGQGRDGKVRVWGHDKGRERGRAWVHDKERVRVWDGMVRMWVLLRISHQQHI